MDHLQSFPISLSSTTYTEEEFQHFTKRAPIMEHCEGSALEKCKQGAKEESEELLDYLSEGPGG